MVPPSGHLAGQHRLLHSHRHVVSGAAAAGTAGLSCGTFNRPSSLRLSLPRGVGCIFYEMVTGRPLFPGSTVEEELHFIFKLLGESQSGALVAASFRQVVRFFTCACRVCSGTPTEHTWPGIRSNDEFVAYNYPQYRADRLSNHTPRYAPGPAPSPA